MMNGPAHCLKSIAFGTEITICLSGITEYLFVSASPPYQIIALECLLPERILPADRSLRRGLKCCRLVDPDCIFNLLFVFINHSQ